jgi:exopolysaccharide biosynthesis protein
MQVKDITGINIIDITGTDFKGKLMEINDPSKVTIGLAPELGQAGALLSEIVNVYKAVGGINAGGFLDDNVTGSGANPYGIIIENGKIKFIQNELKTFSVIGFTNNNILVISNSMNLDQIKNGNLRCAISFGPALILNGKPLVEKGGTYLAPRSAIAQRKDGTILLLVIDGRQSYSPGANYMDIQNIFLKYDAYNAANLDGGLSTTLNYQGRTINKPCGTTGERSIPTAFLIMP